MPKNKVNNPITDQEIAFARLVLSGTMTDRDAAQAAGLSPDSAAYTKSKPRVRAYMLEHRAAVQQQLVEQEVNGLRQMNIGREQVLRRLWELANMSPDMTRNSITGQVKAVAIIVAIEGLIPDRRAGSASPQRAAENPPAPPPTQYQIYPAAWLRAQREKAGEPKQDPAYAQEEDGPAVAEPASASATNAPPRTGPAADPSEPNFADGFSDAETTPAAPSTPVLSSVPDARGPLCLNRNAFSRRRR